jgi:murein DD-endopeptidase MepM/ murein hydrolase activator NlpD
MENITPKSSVIGKNKDYFIESKGTLEILPIFTVSEVGTIEKETEILDENKIREESDRNESDLTLSKFFKRTFKFVNSIEKFLLKIQSLTFKSIEQKKLIENVESSEQKRKVATTKRAIRKEKEGKKDKKQIDFSDISDDQASLLLYSLFGIVAGSGQDAQTGSIADVPYEALKGKLIQKGKTTVGQISGYPVTSGFGWRWGKTHGGVDVGVPEGTMFAVKANSKVVFAGWQDPTNTKKGYGLMVDVWVDQIQQMIRFAHLSSISVKVGDTLTPGTILGRSGSTGRSTGPHFHIEAHDSVTSEYGKKDPTPYLGYVILGDTVQDKESEGGVKFAQRIMVGEAGPEIVTRISDFPLFMESVIHEKVRSIIPEYVPPMLPYDISLREYGGSYGRSYASGGITENHKIAARKLNQFFPGKPHVVAGILGNLEHEAPGLKPDTYQYGGGPGRGIAQWEINHKGNDFKGRWPSAVRLYGEDVINSLPKQLDFIKWELDTSHVVDGQSRMPSGTATKKYVVDKPKDVSEATHNFMYDFERPDSIAQANWKQERLSKAIIFMSSMNLLLGKSEEKPPSKPEVKPSTKPSPKPMPRAKPTNIIEAVWDFGIKKGLKDASEGWNKFFENLKPKRNQSSLLNNIPGSIQEQVAYETQRSYDIDESGGQVMIFYKPTIKYPSAA